MANYYYSGQGSLLVAKRDPATGKPLGFLPIGNVPDLSLDIAVSKKEHKESESGDRLLDLTLVTEKKGTFKFKLENLSLDNLAMGLYGEAATVALGTVVAENVTVYKGKRMPLNHPNVSAVIVKDDADLITYVAGTDYILDAKNGTLEFLIGSALVELDVVHVAYSYGAYSNLEAFTQAVSPERWLRFQGLNTVDGSHVIIDAYRAQFDPLTNYALINEDVVGVDMAGSLLADSFVVSGSKFFRQRNVAA